MISRNLTLVSCLAIHNDERKIVSREHQPDVCSQRDSPISTGEKEALFTLESQYVIGEVV
ncbi:MAG: hypothetical protein NPIRA06_17790 [Nitrospirales bacterium]|nr:MAG: hypothetical protein NPIRA06_17790 [Nitrospirales bacterium]